MFEGNSSKNEDDLNILKIEDGFLNGNNATKLRATVVYLTSLLHCSLGSVCTLLGPKCNFLMRPGVDHFKSLENNKVYANIFNLVKLIVNSLYPDKKSKL